jgi:predicted component of type VI protein secretion system
MQAVLVMIRSDGERRSFSIARDMTVVGRREDCDLRIPLGEISRKHCRLVRDGEALRLEDLGSSNGTFHNGERIQESILGAGDTIQIGPVVFVLQLDGVPADEDLQPVAAQEIEGGGTDIGGEVTQSEYASEGEYTEGEYAQKGEEVQEGEPALEAEAAAEWAEPTAEGEPSAEWVEPAVEAEPAAEWAEPALEDEVSLEEPVEAGAELEATEEDFNPLADMEPAAGEAHALEEVEDFTSLETPEPPHG